MNSDSLFLGEACIERKRYSGKRAHDTPLEGLVFNKSQLKSCQAERKGASQCSQEREKRD